MSANVTEQLSAETVQLLKLAHADLATLDTAERFFRQDEVRMILTPPEAKFLIMISPESTQRNLIKARTSYALGQPGYLFGTLDNYPAVRVYLPLGTYLFPIAVGRHTPMHPQDALYGLHQSPNLMAKVYTDLVHPETGEVVASTPDPLPRDMQWIQAMLKRSQAVKPKAS